MVISDPLDSLACVKGTFNRPTGRPGMTRPRSGEPRARTKILEASRQLFSRRGFSETSMGDIAKAAQVARATVYNNFGDKQDILAEIIRDYMTGYARISTRLRENARSGETSFDLIQEMVREALVGGSRTPT